MILKIDYYFTYKNTLRFLLIQKLSLLNNTYNLPQIQKIIYFFFFKKLEDLDDVELYNSFYLFKFFFGRKVFFTKTYSFYSLGKYYYNFNIQLVINKSHDIYFLLFFLKNNIILFLDHILIKKGYISNTLYFLQLKDIKIFSEIKTNLGLFYLKNSININIYLLGCENLNYNKVFINLLNL